MSNYFNHNGAIYMGSNSRITGMHGTPVNTTGLQPNVDTPHVPYRGYNWGCVPASTPKVECSQPFAPQTTKKHSWFQKLFR